ncbi:uncharacterized protein LOC127788893 isoform X2 [Diospyros lotus]|uniref:uncharacterized protein LOC127788893 isoform X2 n=1 Tax=Diospyros lotus TaxID=55363 RepID=UPI00224ECB2D|nr:uncharacterized protein LOC127788893 isoform X2 [Diospyros lotus]
MFRLHRQNRPSKSGERVDFKFSNFQAIQVPKGWDKLFVSVVSLETGKMIAKSSKAPMRNGNCQWTETLSESMWIPQDDSVKKALEECNFKFIVAMGSARSGILGEATVNMASCLSSKVSDPVLLPLKKCNYGTILQVKIHCLTPRTKLRAEESKDSSSSMEDQNADHQDTEGKSNASDDSAMRNVGSPSSQDLGSTSHPGELQSRETSTSASGSQHSFDSAEGSIGKEIFSSRSDLDGEKHPVGRQESISSLNGSSHGNYPDEDLSQSNRSSFNSRVVGSGNDSQNIQQESAQSLSCVIPSASLTNAGSSKNLLEAAEDAIEELRAEAKMWERNARKLMLDLDILRNEFSDQAKKQAEKDMELSATFAECDTLKMEVGHLRLILEETTLKQTAREDSPSQYEGAIQIQKELENEIKFQQESNTNLAMQLKRSQEANIELVTVLQELEETIEKQRVEIENLSAVQLKVSDMENSIQEKEEENRNLLLQLQQLQESENELQANLRLLEKCLEGKSIEAENDVSLKTLNNQTLLDIETEYKCKLAAKEQEIASLEAKLQESFINREPDYGGKGDLIREIEALKEKLQELESDCSELTNENLELLFKLKDSKKNLRQSCMSCDSSSGEFPDKSFAISESEEREFRSGIQGKNSVAKNNELAVFETSMLFPDLVEQLQKAFYHIKKPWYNISSHVDDELESDLAMSTETTSPKGSPDFILNSFIELNKLLEARIIQCEEVLKQDELEIKERNNHVSEAQKKLEDSILKENNLRLSIQELEDLNMDLEAKLTALEKELNNKRSEIKKLEDNLLLKEEEIGFIRHYQGELESQISDLGKEKGQLEENMDIVLRERNTTSKCLDDLQNELMVLNSSLDSHVSANKILERKCSDLESQKHELELHLANLEEEKGHLSECISGLEAQLRDMTDEREACLLETNKSKSVATRLQDEIRRLGTEMETERLELKQKLQDMQNQMSEAQGEYENLKIENKKLQVSIASLIEEYNTLRNANGLLRKQKLELQEQFLKMETELRESQNKSSDYSKRIQALEEDLSATLEDFALKESGLTLELDALLQENRNQKEKLVSGESLLNQLHSEKTAAVDDLQREIEHLSKQICASHDERERIASEAVEEVSILRNTKAKLEMALQESELKIQDLMVELKTHQKNHELRVADHAKLLKNLGSYRSSEEKLKTTLNDLELKLTVSEYERQQFIEETSNLKVQFQKVTDLRDEIQALRSELDSLKFGKEKLEASLHSVSEECEELKVEKAEFLRQISCLQTIMSELEDCKHKKVALEEKLVQVEGDLLAREALYAQDAELKNELRQIKRQNNQLQSKMQQLEEEKDVSLQRTQALEKQIKLMEQQKKDGIWSTSKKGLIRREKQQCNYFKEINSRR